MRSLFELLSDELGRIVEEVQNYRDRGTYEKQRFHYRSLHGTLKPILAGLRNRLAAEDSERFYTREVLQGYITRLGEARPEKTLRVFDGSEGFLGIGASKPIDINDPVFNSINSLIAELNQQLKTMPETQLSSAESAGDDQQLSTKQVMERLEQLSREQENLKRENKETKKALEGQQEKTKALSEKLDASNAEVVLYSEQVARAKQLVISAGSVNSEMSQALASIFGFQLPPAIEAPKQPTLKQALDSKYQGKQPDEAMKKEVDWQKKHPVEAIDYDLNKLSYFISPKKLILVAVLASYCLQKEIDDHSAPSNSTHNFLLHFIDMSFYNTPIETLISEKGDEVEEVQKDSAVMKWIEQEWATYAVNDEAPNDAQGKRSAVFGSLQKTGVLFPLHPHHQNVVQDVVRTKIDEIMKGFS